MQIAHDVRVRAVNVTQRAISAASNECVGAVDLL